jgi:CHAD domain-containing protein
MELELALHADDAGKLPHLPVIEAARDGRARSIATRTIWHDSPDRALAGDGLSLAEHRGRWRLERLRPEADQVWPPGTPPPSLGEADQPNGLPADLPTSLAPVAAFEGRLTTIPLLIDGDGLTLRLLRGVVRTVTAEHPIVRLHLDGPDLAVRDLALALAEVTHAQVPHASLAAEALATAAGTLPEPRRIGAPLLGPVARASVGGAFRHVIGHLTDVILHEAPLATQHPEALEHVHQMRVAVRRARSAIAVFRDALDGATLAAANAQLRALGQRLAPAREWDVFTAEIAPVILAALPHDVRLAQLVNAAQRQRREAHAALRAWFGGVEFRRMGIALAWLAAAESWMRPPEPQAPAPGLEDFATSALRRRWRKLTAAGKSIAGLDAPAMHGLRLRAKRMRYAAEIFMTLFPGKPTDRFIRRLSTLQGRLGELNDVATTEQLLRALGGAGSRHGYATGLVIGFAAAAANGLRPRILHAWDRFARLDPFWI